LSEVKVDVVERRCDMKKKKVKEVEIKKANTVELGSRPPFGRIVWISQSKNEKGGITPHSGASHEGLRKAIEKNDMIAFFVVDMKNGVMLDLGSKKIKRFLDLWKDRYFDPKFGEKSLLNKFFKEK
jgi:hypothetical protein